MSYVRCPVCEQTLQKIDVDSDLRFCLNGKCDFMYANIKTGELKFKGINTN